MVIVFVFEKIFDVFTVLQIFCGHLTHNSNSLMVFLSYLLHNAYNVKEVLLLTAWLQKLMI